MIDLNDFREGFKKVEHTLVNTWDWSRVQERLGRNVAINPRYYRDLGDGGFTLGGMERDDYCAQVLHFLGLNKPEYHPRAGMYVSALPTSKSFPRHNDPGQYLWIWQIIGNTKWIVDGSELVLAEGEVLYISPGIYHQAVPDSPRASITFSLEKYE